MEIKYYLKAAAYESLFRKSVKNPESIRNFKGLYAYRHFYYSTYKGQEPEPLMQFDILKRRIADTIEKLGKQRINRTKKSQLIQLLPELQNASEDTELDDIIEKALELILSPE